VTTTPKPKHAKGVARKVTCSRQASNASGNSKTSRSNSGSTNTRSSISSGSFSEPKPDHNVRRQKQAATKKFGAATIAEAVANYKLTRTYESLCSTKFDNQLAVDKANRWIKANLVHIDPAKQQICQVCGEVGFYFCNCRLDAAKDSVSKHADMDAKFSQSRMFGLIKTKIDLDVNNNHQIGPMLPLNNYWVAPSEAVIPDDFIDECMYNYILTRQHAEYPSRKVKLEHSMALARKYQQECKVKAHELSNRESKIMLLTASRATDQVEGSFLLSYTNPNTQRGFCIVLLTLLFVWLTPCFMRTTNYIRRLFRRIWKSIVRLVHTLVISNRSRSGSVQNL
jgi:hypothetical protein